MKICKNCNEAKSLKLFYKNKNRKDGYENCCIECYKNKRKKHGIICKNCGKEFFSGKKNALYCCHKCSVEDNTIYKPKQCIVCSTVFKPKNNESLYCSTECRHIADRKERNKYTCDYCGIIFERLECFVKGKHHIFCSYKCKDSANKIYYSKENHPRWDNNKSEMERENNRLIYGYENWRKSVYERDNYTCQCCGDNKGGNLNAHHLDGYNWCKEKRTDVDNGITLCDKCHKDFHKEYGYTNNTKEQFYKWILI